MLYTILYLLPIIISLAISVMLAVYTWQRKQVIGAKPFALMAVAQATIIAGYLLELVSRTLVWKIFWDDAQWVGVFIAPLAYLAFAQEYSWSRPAKPRRLWITLSIVPAVSLILIITNKYHHLIRSSASLIPGYAFDVLYYEFTPVVYAMFIYVYIIMIASVVVFIRAYWAAERYYRFQISTILAGIMIPILGAVLSIFEVLPPSIRDITPFTSAVGNVVVAWGMFRYQLFNVVPVARNKIIDNMSDMVVVLDAQNRVIDLNPSAKAFFEVAGKNTIGKDSGQIFGTWTGMAESSKVAAEGRRELSVDRAHEQRILEIRETSMADGRGELAGRFMILRDVTDQRRIEQLEHEQRVFAQALIDVIAAINSTLDPDELLERILDNVEKVVPHEWADIAFVEKDSARVVRERHKMPPGEEAGLLDSVWPISETLPLKKMAETGDAYRIDALRQAEWFHRDARFDRLNWAGSYLAVPIMVKQKAIGFINLLKVEEGFYTASHEARLLAFANQAAIALENARLFELGRSAAISRERQRIAQEIHNSVSQTVFASNTMAELAVKAMDKDPAKARGYLFQLNQLTRGAMAELRSLMIELRPDAIAKSDLGTLIAYLCDAFTGNSQIEVEFRTSGKIRLDQQAQFAFYRVTQEAMDNINLHAAASHVIVSLNQMNGKVELRIEDDGRGFDVERELLNGEGLAAMREYAKNAKAELNIKSQINKGTEIILSGASGHDTRSNPGSVS